MTSECPKCHTENTSDSQFCKKCATPIPSSIELTEPLTQTINTPESELKGGTVFAKRYEIVKELGRGGMGVVYKAKDKKLKRLIALKFLSPELTRDSEAKERFIHEAQAASALDHSNICTVHEIDEAEGKIFIAMAFIDGESLREKIRSGPLKLSEAFEIAKQIAEGLNEAHKKGIVHRDIKSANIMVASNGQVKVMDFGLAKLVGRTKFTRTGTTMGTVSYMSPEQSLGESVDHRADIWSLGVVLYEMICGQLPFKGEHDQAVIYSIRNDDPNPLTALRSGLPIELDWIVGKLLAKDPEARYQHLDELSVDLKALDSKSTKIPSSVTMSAFNESTKEKVHTQKRKLLMYSGLSAVLTLLIAAFSVFILFPQRKQLPRPMVHFTFSESPPRDINFGLSRTPALSPDGKIIVYLDYEEGRLPKLNLRFLDRLESVSIPGTEGARYPFFSPDSRYLGYSAENKLMKVLIDGGSPLIICELDDNVFLRGGTWGTDDTIIFGSLSGLKQVAASAGKPVLITTIDQENDVELIHTFPKILPDNKGVLFTILPLGDWSSARVALYSFRTKTWQILLDETAINARYIPTGHIVYEREGILMAMSFDLNRLKVIGSPEQVLGTNIMRLKFDVSDDGSLIYMPAQASQESPQRSLVLVDRNGTETTLTTKEQLYGSPRISPDGKHLALNIHEPYEDYGWIGKVWVYDMERSIFIQQSFEESFSMPIWTPDGNGLIYNSNITGTLKVYRKLVNSTEESEEFLGRNVWFTSWTPDGRAAAFYENIEKDNYDVKVLDVEEKTEISIANSAAIEISPMFSRDGRFIAYGSDESGRQEIYVQPYPPTGRKWQISSEGGTEPVWAPEGKELFYRNGDNMMAVLFQTSPEFRPGIPKKLFEGIYNYYGRGWAPAYDILPDGKKFLMVKEAETEEIQQITQIHIVLNWFEELNRIFTEKK